MCTSEEKGEFMNRTLRAIDFRKGRKYNVELLHSHGVKNPNAVYVTICDLFGKEVPEGGVWKLNAEGKVPLSDKQVQLYRKTLGVFTGESTKFLKTMLNTYGLPSINKVDVSYFDRDSIEIINERNSSIDN